MSGSRLRNFSIRKPALKTPLRASLWLEKIVVSPEQVIWGMGGRSSGLLFRVKMTNFSD